MFDRRYGIGLCFIVGLEYILKYKNFFFNIFFFVRQDLRRKIRMYEIIILY